MESDEHILLGPPLFRLVDRLEAEMSDYGWDKRLFHALPSNHFSALMWLWTNDYGAFKRVLDEAHT